MGWRVFDLFGWAYFIFSSVCEFIAARMQNATNSDGAETLRESDGALVPMDENDTGPSRQGNSRDENSESPPVITIENHDIFFVGDQATTSGTKEKKNKEDSKIKDVVRLPVNELNEEVASPEKKNKKQKRRRKKKSSERDTSSSPSKDPAVVARFNEIDKSLSKFREDGNLDGHKHAIEKLLDIYSGDKDNFVLILLLNYEEAAALCDKNKIDAAMNIVNKVGYDIKKLITQTSDLKHINDIRLIIFCKCLFLASRLYCISKKLGKAEVALNIADMKLSECNNVELKAQFHLANAYLQLSFNQSHCTSERASRVIEHTNKAEHLCTTLTHETYEKIKRKILLLRCKAIIQFYQDGGDKEEFDTVFNNSIKELECDRVWRDISPRQKIDFEIIKSNYFKIHDNDARALDHAKEALQIAQKCDFKKEVSLLDDEIRKLEIFPDDLDNDGEGLVQKVLAIRTTTDGPAESNATEMDWDVFCTDDSDWDTYDSLRQLPVDAARVPTCQVSSTTCKVSLPKEETWLDEFCRIRQSENVPVETYHSMLKGLRMLVNLVGDNVESFFGKNLTLNRCCCEIERFLLNIEASEDDPGWHIRNNVRSTIFYLKKAISWLLNITIDLEKAMTQCALAMKEASQAFSKCSSIENALLVAKLQIISQIMSNLTKPEAAIPWCLQSLQELHDLPAVRAVFSSLNYEETDSVMFFADSVFKMNKTLFEFVQAFFRPPPTVEEWPVAIQLLNNSFYYPLIEKRQMHAETKIDVHEVEDRVQNPVTNVAGYSHMITESCGQTANKSITVDQKGGCFSLPEVCAFLLFPPNAVDERVTLKCCRVKHKECKMKLSNGEVFVSRILKIEPEGVMFKKPVTVLLSHSLDEDQDFMCFYELIVENFSPTGYQELKTEPISSIEDVPKEICNGEVLVDFLPLAKATIEETCTLAAATRARFIQILIPTNRRYVFCKQYGEIAELKITFPAGVTEEILSLKVQLFPADAVVNKDIRLSKSLVCAPIIRVSGQKTSFLEPVYVELTYSHSDVANIKEEFLPVGKTIQFTTEYGLLLRNNSETESKPNWQAVNKSDDVIERLRKDQLKLSFSVKHFSDVQPVVKISPVSYIPPTSTGMVSLNNPACHLAIVLAVHEAGSSPKTLRAVLAPKQVKPRLHKKWKVEPLRFMNRLKDEESIYFCVPMPDTTESCHLFLEDYTLWFDPDDESELSNNTNDDDDLRGKEMRFLKDRQCNNGENHTMQGDCRAKFPIYTSECSSVLQTSTERPGILQDRNLPRECNVLSDQEDAAKSRNKISKMIMHRCESFETTVESLAERKLKINEAFVEDPKGGKATKFVEVAGPTATMICCLAGGITIALNVATYGAPSFAAALVASAALVVKIVDKHVLSAKAKVINDIVNAEIETTNVSSYLNCVVKDVAKELSRIFEYQLLRLENDKQIEILAECAVDLMLDLNKNDTFDRNTLLKKVLHDGQIKKRKLVTKIKDIKWSAPNVFRKPGLRRIIFEKDVAKFKYFVKPNGSCKAWKYGYRGQFLELKKYISRNEKSETPHAEETNGEDLNCDAFCKNCSLNCEKHPSDHYFSESDIDAQYTDDPLETLTYHPVHILIHCPNVLDCFQQFQGERPPLASFLKRKLGLPEDHVVHPVYRPHSPGKVFDLQKSDFTGSDFSHCDFTGSCFENCNFAQCVMLFAKLAGVKFSGSKFRDTFISHSDLMEVKADRCEWTKTSLLYSRLDGALVGPVEPSIAGNCLKGTNICDAIDKMKEINCNDEEQR